MLGGSISGQDARVVRIRFKRYSAAANRERRTCNFNAPSPTPSFLCRCSFKGEVQLIQNSASHAGGFYNWGGTTTFEKRVKMIYNSAQENGGAFSLVMGTVQFDMPDMVTATGNTVRTLDDLF